MELERHKWTTFWILLFLLVMNTVLLAGASGCKKVIITDEQPGKELTNHVEANFTGVTEVLCRIKCFISDTCQSYNYDNSSQTCQTSTSTRVQNPDDVINKTNSIYVGFENQCDDIRCPSGKKCKANFEAENFRCIDAVCFHGPCKNQGTCSAVPGDSSRYTCACAPGFAGVNCEMEGCQSNPCQNGGDCLETGDGSYSCMCPTGYTAMNCEKGNVDKVDKLLKSQEIQLTNTSPACANTFTTKDQKSQRYLTSLREYFYHKRSKKAKGTSPACANTFTTKDQKKPKGPTGKDVLLVHDDCAKNQWKTAVIEILFPGKDGLIRSVLVRAGNGHQLRRPIEKLYLLEIAEDSDPEEVNDGELNKDT